MTLYKKLSKCSSAHNVCNLRYPISCEINIFTYNRSNYDFHLIIKGLADKFKNSDFTCLGGNTEKCMVSCFNEQTCEKIYEKTYEETVKLSNKRWNLLIIAFLCQPLSDLTDNLSQKASTKKIY